MVIKAVLFILCAIVLIVLYRTKAVLKMFFKIEEPSEELLLRIKYILLVVATILFIAAVILNK